MDKIPTIMDKKIIRSCITMDSNLKKTQQTFTRLKNGSKYVEYEEHGDFVMNVRLKLKNRKRNSI